jgi:hypothetical protein
MRRGFPQRVEVRVEPDPTVYQVDGFLVMHPATADRLRAEIARRGRAMVDEIAERAISGMTGPGEP